LGGRGPGAASAVRPREPRGQALPSLRGRLAAGQAVRLPGAELLRLVLLFGAALPGALRARAGLRAHALDEGLLGLHREEAHRPLHVAHADLHAAGVRPDPDQDLRRVHQHDAGDPLAQVHDAVAHGAVAAGQVLLPAAARERRGPRQPRPADPGGHRDVHRDLPIPGDRLPGVQWPDPQHAAHAPRTLS